LPWKSNGDLKLSQKKPNFLLNRPTGSASQSYTAPLRKQNKSQIKRIMKKFITLLAFTASMALFTPGSAQARDQHRSSHSSHRGEHSSRHDSGHSEYDSGYDSRYEGHGSSHGGSYGGHQSSGCQQGNGSRYEREYRPEYNPRYEQGHRDCGPRFPSIGRGPFGLPGFLFGFGSR
jgi:hypothetical protein